MVGSRTAGNRRTALVVVVLFVIVICILGPMRKSVQGLFEDEVESTLPESATADPQSSDEAGLPKVGLGSQTLHKSLLEKSGIPVDSSSKGHHDPDQTQTE